MTDYRLDDKALSESSLVHDVRDELEDVQEEQQSLLVVEGVAGTSGGSGVLPDPPVDTLASSSLSNNLLVPIIEQMLGQMAQQWFDALWQIYIEPVQDRYEEFGGLKASLLDPSLSLADKLTTIQGILEPIEEPWSIDLQLGSELFLKLLELKRRLTAGEAGVGELPVFFELIDQLLSISITHSLLGEEQVVFWRNEMQNARGYVRWLERLRQVPRNSPEAFFSAVFEAAFLPDWVSVLLEQAKRLFQRLEMYVAAAGSGQTETLQWLSGFVHAFQAASTSGQKMRVMFDMLQHQDVLEEIKGLIGEEMPALAEALHLSGLVAAAARQVDRSKGDMAALLAFSQRITSQSFIQQLRAVPTQEAAQYRSEAPSEGGNALALPAVSVNAPQGQLSHAVSNVLSQAGEYLVPDSTSVTLINNMIQVTQGNMGWLEFSQAGLSALEWWKIGTYVIKNAIKLAFGPLRTVIDLASLAWNSSFVSEMSTMEWRDIPRLALRALSEEIDRPGSQLLTAFDHTPVLGAQLQTLILILNDVATRDNWLELLGQRVATYVRDVPLIMVFEKLIKFGLMWQVWKACEYRGGDRAVHQALVGSAQKKVHRMMELFPETRFKVLNDMIGWIPVLRGVYDMSGALPKMTASETSLAWGGKVIAQLANPRAGADAQQVQLLQENVLQKMQPLMLESLNLGATASLGEASPAATQQDSGAGMLTQLHAYYNNVPEFIRGVYADGNSVGQRVQGTLRGIPGRFGQGMTQAKEQLPQLVTQAKQGGQQALKTLRGGTINLSQRLRQAIPWKKSSALPTDDAPELPGFEEISLTENIVPQKTGNEQTSMLTQEGEWLPASGAAAKISHWWLALPSGMKGNNQGELAEKKSLAQRWGGLSSQQKIGLGVGAAGLATALTGTGLYFLLRKPGAEEASEEENQILTQEEYEALKQQYHTELAAVQRKQNIAKGITIGSGVTSLLLLGMGLGIRGGKWYEQYKEGKIPEEAHDGAMEESAAEEKVQALPELQYDLAATDIYRPTTAALDQPAGGGWERLKEKENLFWLAGMGMLIPAGIGGYFWWRYARQKQKLQTRLDKLNSEPDYKERVIKRVLEKMAELDHHPEQVTLPVDDEIRLLVADVAGLAPEQLASSENSEQAPRSRRTRRHAFGPERGGYAAALTKSEFSMGKVSYFIQPAEGGILPRGRTSARGGRAQSSEASATVQQPRTDLGLQIDSHIVTEIKERRRTEQHSRMAVAGFIPESVPRENYDFHAYLKKDLSQKAERDLHTQRKPAVPFNIKQPVTLNYRKYNNNPVDYVKSAFLPFYLMQLYYPADDMDAISEKFYGIIPKSIMPKIRQHGSNIDEIARKTYYDSIGYNTTVNSLVPGAGNPYSVNYLQEVLNTDYPVKFSAVLKRALKTPEVKAAYEKNVQVEINTALKIAEDKLSGRSGKRVDLKQRINSGQATLHPAYMPLYATAYYEKDLDFKNAYVIRHATSDKDVLLFLKEKGSYVRVYNSVQYNNVSKNRYYIGTDMDILTDILQSSDPGDRLNIARNFLPATLDKIENVYGEAGKKMREVAEERLLPYKKGTRFEAHDRKISLNAIPGMMLSHAEDKLNEIADTATRSFSEINSFKAMDILDGITATISAVLAFINPYASAAVGLLGTIPSNLVRAAITDDPEAVEGYLETAAFALVTELVDLKLSGALESVLKGAVNNGVTRTVLRGKALNKILDKIDDMAGDLITIAGFEYKAQIQGQLLPAFKEKVVDALKSEGIYSDLATMDLSNDASGTTRRHIAAQEERYALLNQRLNQLDGFIGNTLVLGASSVSEASYIPPDAADWLTKVSRLTINEKSWLYNKYFAELGSMEQTRQNTQLTPVSVPVQSPESQQPPRTQQLERIPQQPPQTVPMSRPQTLPQAAVGSIGISQQFYIKRNLRVVFARYNLRATSESDLPAIDLSSSQWQSQVNTASPDLLKKTIESSLTQLSQQVGVDFDYRQFRNKDEKSVSHSVGSLGIPGYSLPRWLPAEYNAYIMGLPGKYRQEEGAFFQSVVRYLNMI